MTMQTDIWIAPCGITFKVVRSRSTYSVAVFDNTGARIAWSGRQWGTALTDSLMMAAHYGEPLRANSAIWFLFGRIDYYRDMPGIIDLWRAATLQGQTVAERDARRRERILRSFNRNTATPHIDAKRGMERDAMAADGTIDAMIADGLIRLTTNGRGQPAMALA